MRRFLKQGSSIDSRNAFFLVFEVVWSGIFAIVSTFLPIYAIRLGATNTEIGLLSSLPALFTILLSIAAARFLEARANPERLTFTSLALFRASHLLLVLVPLAAFLDEHQGKTVIVLMIVASILSLIYNTGIWPFYMRVIPPEQRAAIFSTQNILSNLVTGSGVILAGYVLSSLTFPRNYQWVITVGVVLSLFSLYCFGQVKIPHQAFDIKKVDVLPQTATDTVDFRRLLNLRTDFGRAVINQVFQYIGVWAATPLMTIYLVKELMASESWIGLNNSILFFGQLAGWFIASQIIQRFGEPRTLKMTSQLTVLQPLLIGLSTTLTPILFVTALYGMLHPSYSLSHTNTLLRTFPAGHEHEAIAVYNTINRLGIFVFPILGVAISEWLGDVRMILIACGVISLVGSLSFHVWPVFQDALRSQSETF